MEKMLLTGPIVFTGQLDDQGETPPVLRNGAVLVRGGVIEDVGPIQELARAHPDAWEENIGEGLLTPGLVNIHHHLYSAFARGWNPPGQSPQDFGQVLERIWWRLDSALNLEDVYYSALVGLCESALSGVTCVVDHHSSQKAVKGSLDAVGKAFLEVGLRGSVCFELSDRGGKEVLAAGLRETVDALAKWPYQPGRAHGEAGAARMAGQSPSDSGKAHDVRGGGPPDATTLLTAMVGLHASMTLSDESLKLIAGSTAKLGAGYHFHLAEDVSDQDDCLKRHGKRVTRRFADFGFLNERSLAVHGVHLDKSEVEILRNSHANLALCPRSNQNNAVGFPKWWEYRGILAGLGTDGIGSDILTEARSALYLSRHVTGDPDFGFEATKRLLLASNPEIYEKIAGVRVGKMAKGRPADLVLWRYTPPTPFTSEGLWGHLLYGLSTRRADSVWVSGRQILRGGTFVNLDYNESMKKAELQARELWKRV